MMEKKKIISILAIITLITTTFPLIIQSPIQTIKAEKPLPPILPHLNISIVPDSAKLYPGETETFLAVTYNGTPPFTYAWKVNDTETNCSQPSFEFGFEEPSSFVTLSVMISDFDGAFGYASVLVYDPAFTSIPKYIEPVMDWDYLIQSNTTHAIAYNGSTWKADFGPSTDHLNIFNWVSGNLTTGKTWFETIKVKGNFVIDGTVLFEDSDAYTRVDLTDAKISLADGANAHMIKLQSVANIKIIGGFLDGNSAGQTSGSSCIALYDCSNIEIAKVWARDSYQYGLQLQNVSDSEIKECTIEDTQNLGIYWHEVNYTKLTDSMIKGTKLCGIQSTDSYHNQLIGNTFRDVWGIQDGTNYGYDGIKFAQGSVGNSYNIVSGNICVNNTRDGMDYKGGDHNVITGNVFVDNGFCPTGGNGLDLKGGQSYTTVANNVAEHNNGTGIAVAINTPAEGISIVGNTVHNNVQGISFSGTGGSLHAVISGNTVTNTTLYHGIWLIDANHTIIDGNTVINSGCERGDQAVSGICLALSSSYNLVTNNLCYDDQPTKSQVYGIAEQNDADYNEISHNIVWDNAQSVGINPLGNHTKVTENPGYNPRGRNDNTVSGSFLVDSGSGTIQNATLYTCAHSPKVIYVIGSFDLIRLEDDIIWYEVAVACVYLSVGNTFKIQWSGSTPQIKVFRQ